MYSLYLHLSFHHDLNTIERDVKHENIIIYLKWNHKLWTHSLLQIGMSVKNQNRKTNNIDPDKIACYEASYPDLHCLHLILIYTVCKHIWLGLQG